MSARICPDCEKSTDFETCPDCGTPTLDNVIFRPRVDPLIGKLVNGRYLVQEVLGQGGMGKVYVAEQIVMKRQVALKVIRVGESGDAATKMAVFKRFQQEALASSRLEHHNTVRVFDFGITEDGTLFIAMELLRGTTLSKIMRGEPMASRRAIRIAIQLCRSLAEAHQKGIVHRDLKPDNVMVFDTPGESDFVKLLDFGIAKITAVGGDSDITRTGMIMGTPAYMAPEQATAGLIGPGTDLYALGVILYEALTGHPPFTGGTPLAVLLKHVSEEVPPIVVDGFPPDVPQQLIDIVFRLLEKKPSARPASAMDVARMLESVNLDGRVAAGVSKPVASPVNKAAVAYAPAQSEPLVPTDPIVKTEFMGSVAPVPSVQQRPVVQPQPVVQPKPVVPPVTFSETDFSVAAPAFRRRWWVLIGVLFLAVLTVGVALWINQTAPDAEQVVSAPMPASAAIAPAVSPDIQPVKVAPVAVEPAKIEPVKVEPVKVEPVKVEPAMADPVKVAPVVVEPVKVEPAKVVSAVVEPVRVEPAKVKPDAVKVKPEPAKVSPKPEVRPAPRKPSLPRCIRSKCPFSGDCVDKDGGRINGASFCDDLAI